MPIDESHDYTVWTADWRGGMASDVTGRGHTVRVDEPPEFGGEDSGPMPTELIAIALSSCMCIAIAWAARKRRVELEDLRVHVQPHRVVGEPRHGAYDLWIESSTPAADLAPVVDLAKRYCWVTNTISTPPEIRYHMGAPAHGLSESNVERGA
jgi:putative redox protein